MERMSPTHSYSLRLYECGGKNFSCAKILRDDTFPCLPSFSTPAPTEPTPASTTTTSYASSSTTKETSNEVIYPTPDQPYSSTPSPIKETPSPSANALPSIAHTSTPRPIMCFDASTERRDIPVGKVVRETCSRGGPGVQVSVCGPGGELEIVSDLTNCISPWVSFMEQRIVKGNGVEELVQFHLPSFLSSFLFPSLLSLLSLLFLHSFLSVSV